MIKFGGGKKSQHLNYDICVIGGCSIDLTYYEDGSKETFFGGKASNQAVASARSGAKTCIITKLGKDEYCLPIIENLKNNGVDVFATITTLAKNDVSKIYIKNGDNTIERHSEMIKKFDKKLIDKYKDVILSSKFIVIQNKAPHSFTKNLVEFCNEHGKQIVLTPSNPSQLSIKDNDNLKLINKISYICANEKETKIVFNSENIEEIVKTYPNKLITTLGAKGLIYNDGSKIIKLPAIKIKNVIDTTGAGDTFCGNFVANLVKGVTIHNAIAKAQYASAYKIQFKSAQAGMPTKQELEKFVRGCHENRAKI